MPDSTGPAVCVTVAGRTDDGALVLHVPAEVEETVLARLDEAEAIARLDEVGV